MTATTPGKSYLAVREEMPKGTSLRAAYYFTAYRLSRWGSKVICKQLFLLSCLIILSSFLNETQASRLNALSTAEMALAESAIPSAPGNEELDDSTIMLLPDLEVTGGAKANRSRNAEGAVKVTTNETLRLTRAFGEADLIASLKGLPGVSAGSDYGSGISINGASPYQTQYLLDGVPVVFPFRFGGIFSTFNSSHFSGLTFQPHAPAAFSPRLGGSVELQSATRFKDGADGIVNIGLISSSATVKGGIGGKVALSISGRISYIDQIYGRLLKSERNTLSFSFYDLNASLAWKITENDRLGLTFFHSTDRVGYDDDNYAMETRLRWKNSCGGISYSHFGALKVDANAWISAFTDRLSLSMPQFLLSAPSSLLTGGLNCRLSGEIASAHRQLWEAGVRTELYRTVPQWAILQMAQDIGGISDRQSEKQPQRMVTASAYGGYTLWLLREELKADLSMAAGFFRSQREGMEWWTVPLLSPRLRITWTKERIGETSISLGYYEQFLHQVGFSELGLASDFTVGASPQAPLQKSFAIDISWRRRLPWWGLTLSASAYWSRVRNQTEYQGQVLEVVDEQYDPFLHIVVSDGHNEGLNLALSREFGSINGEISWGYGGGRRHLPEANDESWNALHAPGHSLKGSLSWNPGKHWILSAVYNYSSGRVYTPVESLYLVGGNIAMEYGKRNSARLPYYSRLDLGATYTFQTSIKGTKLSHLVNISILNALGRRNVEMQYFVLNVDKGTYGLKRLYSLYRFIPSISYTLEFR